MRPLEGEPAPQNLESQAQPIPSPDRPLRIAILTETFLPKIDGIVTRLCHTLRHLREFGHEVMIIAPAGIDDFEGIPVYGVSGFPFPLYPDLKIAIPRPSVGKALGAFQPDVIHAVNPAMLAVSAFYYSVRYSRPLVVSYHTHLPKYLSFYHLGMLEPVMWWGMRQGYNRADLTLATSSAMQGELTAKGIQRVQLWRRGVDTERFHPGKASRAMRERLTQGHLEDKLLLYVGRLSAEKEIERCSQVLAAVPGLRLALVGDGPHREKLEKHFAGTPAYFAGYLRGEELAEAFASADVFLLPSRTETLGLVLLESMAAGCPVVTPNAGGTSDIVQDGVTGHLYDPADDEGHVKAVQQLLADPAQHAQVRRNARLDAEQWSWAAATRQLEEYYRGVLRREERLAEEIDGLLAAGQAPEAICSALGISGATLRRHALLGGQGGKRQALSGAES
jgi:glycosyltransferase involved in cell wall biosynthesis